MAETPVIDILSSILLSLLGLRASCRSLSYSHCSMTLEYFIPKEGSHLRGDGR